MNDQPEEQRTWTEEIEVAAHELVERVKDLIEEGNVRRLIIRNPEGETVLEVPLTTGAVVGSVVTIFAPLLAALGAMAALLSRVRVEIVRADVEGGDKGEAEE